jgi:hypothetical protein
LRRRAGDLKNTIGRHRGSCHVCSHILTKAERAANKTMMICVSGCKRGPLVLDI